MDQRTTFKAVNPVIPVRDMSVALEFYARKLGFARVFDDATCESGHISYAGVARCGICLHLQTTAPGEEPTMPQIRIHVENIEPLYEEYRARGVISPGGRLESKPWGSRDFGVYDPNGTALVFYEDI